jgi:hypothetical protein
VTCCGWSDLELGAKKAGQDINNVSTLQSNLSALDPSGHHYY